MIQPAAARATITSGPDRMTITIPPRRSPIVVLMLSIWCVGWVAAAFSSVASDEYPFGPSTAGLAAFACIWAIFFAGVSFILLRALSGREVITVDSATFAISPFLAPFSRRKTFDVAHIRDLRATPFAADLLHPAFSPHVCLPGWVGGHIAFDYGANTYRFGAGVDEAEAKQIVKQIVDRYPSLASDEA